MTDDKVTGYVTLLSGGMDSTTLLGQLHDTGLDVRAVGFDYGQRHRIELGAAASIAEHYGIRYDVVDLTSLGRLLTGSSLTDPAVPVPHGHYAEPSMRATVVPNRNMIMLACAAGVAVANGLNRVATAVHAGDHFVYPDCRPAFVKAASLTTMLGTDTFGDVEVIAPFVHMSKTDIARRAYDLDVPLHLTWSCYEGGSVHCGRCGTCVERREAFADAGLTDPTNYADDPVRA